MNSAIDTMPCTQAYIEMMRGMRGDRRCHKCRWFGHLARHCRQKEILAERRKKSEGGGNKFAPLCQRANSESELSQLLFISVRQRELIRVLASLFYLLIHNSLGLCTNYPALPTKLCVTCPVMWHVTMTIWCDPVTYYVTWCDRVSHTINRKVK